ncbi:shikimate dehydrogenase [Kingella negevensis]|uniref:shikimate dehydrogenase n=1 Tax=Kingella negevensis TaxID=1522312 RepID=UPI00254DEEDA|nr:shikimate dehydrogenase [Kingella negevensis]MDK4685300.1 shikimate dehydrogenase [Kingella negevensis]MDK4696240.1 shikimate dehydrogenase [Kingella negevensis]MDK4707744.1 shikimate dehydrogenase [Kingella negevensis]MDK4709821.1 shikimate dehydrogenase [Kingella negevensis]
MNYTVFGNPIAHSKSPKIHQLFAAQEHATIEYTRTLVDDNPQAFQAAVQQFFAQNGGGANVTLPFKQHAYALAQHHSPRAQAAGAVNTLISQADGTLLGDNTDGLGLVQDLTQNLQFSLKDKRILLLGAGGAARGVILPLLECQPAQFIIANRSPEKAQALATQFHIQAQTFAELSGCFDLIINATSGSVSGSVPEVPPQIFSGCQLAYDMFYSAQPTAFMQFAALNGAAHTSDGLGMLVGQAAASYQLWRNFAPQTAPVIAALRKELHA